jgi:RNase P subunit RPR2
MNPIKLVHDMISKNDEYRQYCKKCKQFAPHNLVTRIPHPTIPDKAKGLVVTCTKCGSNKLLVREE